MQLLCKHFLQWQELGASSHMTLSCKRQTTRRCRWAGEEGGLVTPLSYTEEVALRASLITKQISGLLFEQYFHRSTWNVQWVCEGIPAT